MGIRSIFRPHFGIILFHVINKAVKESYFSCSLTDKGCWNSLSLIKTKFWFFRWQCSFIYPLSHKSLVNMFQVWLVLVCFPQSLTQSCRLSLRRPYVNNNWCIVIRNNKIKNSNLCRSYYKWPLMRKIREASRIFGFR